MIFTYMAGATTVNPESLRFFAKSPRVRQDPAYNVLTEDELSRMLSAARASNYRDYVMLAVMAGCGLREAEVVGLRSGTCARSGGGSGHFASSARVKVRNVQISPELWRLLQRFVLLTEKSFTSYLDSRKPCSPPGSAKTNHSPPARSRTS